MKFVDAIFEEAKKWSTCKETGENRSSCVDKIHNYVRGYVSNDPWCAMFVTMVFDKVCKAFMIPNRIGLTAGTSDLIARAKKAGITVNSTPAVGSIMYYPTGSNSGHVGFVLQVKGIVIYTIEGNTADRVGFREHTVKSNFRFIHIENYAGDVDIPKYRLQTAGVNKFIILGLLISLPIYLYKKSKGQDLWQIGNTLTKEV